MRAKLITAAVSVACATAMLSMASPVFAEGLTRAQVQKECADWMATHEWSEARGWQLKPGVKAPATTSKTNAQVEAETKAFLSNHRWDEAQSRYVSIKGAPRDVSKMTREEVNREAREFHRTHVWDEAASGFVSCKP